MGLLYIDSLYKIVRNGINITEKSHCIFTYRQHNRTMWCEGHLAHKGVKMIPETIQLSSESPK